ncbi:hypothetical protein MTBSS4_320043 [Magnetospirillum sp. SS-4]|nr:hypothetical protein MTBSS4_320043 [Magnetospirillum sp. SS-4]
MLGRQQTFAAESPQPLRNRRRKAVLQNGPDGAADWSCINNITRVKADAMLGAEQFTSWNQDALPPASCASLYEI